MVCARDTRKKITSVHKKMRNIITKHKRECAVLIKAMDKFIQRQDNQADMQSLFHELQSIRMMPDCQTYSNTLDKKFEDSIASLSTTRSELFERAETILEREES